MEKDKKILDKKYIVIIYNKKTEEYKSSVVEFNPEIDKSWAMDYLKSMYCISIKDDISIYKIQEYPNTWNTSINEAWDKKVKQKVELLSEELVRNLRDEWH